MLTVQRLRLGMEFQSNCYIIINENGEAAAVDIGGDPDEMMKIINEKGVKLTKIFLTHGHYDHFRGVADVAEKTGAEVYIHKADEKMMTDARESLAPFIGADGFAPVKRYNVVNDGDVIDFSGVPVEVIHTPGHTKGGVCYVIEDKIFSGDTLFRMSIGRTDFPGGSFDELKKSLMKLRKLAEKQDYVVFPGHEDSTTLLNEAERNPYMR